MVDSGEIFRAGERQCDARCLRAIDAPGDDAGFAVAGPDAIATEMDATEAERSRGGGSGKQTNIFEIIGIDEHHTVAGANDELGIFAGALDAAKRAEFR